MFAISAIEGSNGRAMFSANTGRAWTKPEIEFLYIELLKLINLAQTFN